MVNTSEAFIDALYYDKMYDSAACWKTAVMVDHELRKLVTKKSKIDALKKNIRIWVLGLGWSDMATPWSKTIKY